MGQNQIGEKFPDADRLRQIIIDPEAALNCNQQEVVYGRFYDTRLILRLLKFGSISALEM